MLCVVDRVVFFGVADSNVDAAVDIAGPSLAVLEQQPEKTDCGDDEHRHQ